MSMYSDEALSSSAFFCITNLLASRMSSRSCAKDSLNEWMKPYAEVARGQVTVLFESSVREKETKIIRGQRVGRGNIADKPVMESLTMLGTIPR